MKLRIKDMDISTGGVMVAILHKDDAKHMDLHALDRIRIRCANRSAIAVLDIAQTERAVPIGAIGLFEESLTKLAGKDGDIIDIQYENKPESISFIKKKLEGGKLKSEEIYSIIRDIVDNRLTDIEMTCFVSASYSQGLDQSEVIALTKAVRDTGDILKLDSDMVMDLHCVGGIAGNRTTLIVVPIVAAAGLVIPKTSSRAITSPSGTADTMEALCDVSLRLSKLKRVIKKTNACIVWGGGSMNLAPADDKIISVEFPLSLEIPGQMMASIMAKKAATSITHMLLDIPIGKSAKVKTRQQGKELKDKFLRIAKELGIRMEIIFTDGSQPVGNGIGVSLEARDALWLLQNDPRGPKDLLDKSVYLAGLMLEMGSKAKAGRGEILARQIIESGDAHKKMIEIIKAQGKRITNPDRLIIGDYSHALVAQKEGIISQIDNKSIVRIAKVAGAPEDVGAGVYLHKHLKDHVKKGDKIMTIYCQSKTKLKYAKEALAQFDGYVIQ